MATNERLVKCREHAEQCRAMAELSHHARAKEAFLAAALEWELLASEIQEIEQDRAFLSKAKRSP